MLAVVWTSTSLHLRLINSSTVCLVDIRVWQIMRVILQSGYVSLCICVCALAVCVVPVWPLPPFWSQNIHHSDSPTLLRLIHVHAHRRRKTFGAGSQVSRAEWTLICSNQQTVRLMMWGGTQRCCTHQLQMADMLHTPFHLLPLLLHEILPNNYTPQLWLWLTTPLQKSLHRWTFVRPCKHKTPQRFQINVPHAEVAVVRH